VTRALLLIVAACQGGPGKAPAEGSGSAVAVVVVADAARPDAAPMSDAAMVDAAVADAAAAGPYIVAYDCSHMNAPFGEGGAVFRISYDLGAKTASTLSYEYGKEGPTAIKHVPVVKVLAAEKKATLEAAIGKVLGGGPFKPEYPVPEGTSCFLRIAAAGAAVFEVEKSNPQLHDAATDLIHLLDIPTN